MPVLATVRNSGSHFALSILEQHYERNYMNEVPHGDPVWFGHVENERMHDIRARIEEYPPLIMTMRNPMAVSSSWLKRGKELDQWYKDMWTNLMKLKEEVEDSYWLPVDTHDREERLAIIGERLGKEFTTDWMPRGVFYGAREIKASRGMNLPEARAYFLQHKDFFDQFGYVI